MNLLSKLDELNRLRQSGDLNEEQFAREKAKHLDGFEIQPRMTSIDDSSWSGRKGKGWAWLLAGGLLGIVAVFLPLATMKTPHSGMADSTVSILVDWRGKLGLAGYLITCVLLFLFDPIKGWKPEVFSWTCLFLGLYLLTLSVWLLVLATESHRPPSFPQGDLSLSVGYGPFFNVIASACVAWGGYLRIAKRN